MGSLSALHQHIATILRCALFLLACTVPAVAGGRFGNAVGEMRPGAVGQGSRVFMGRGMIVSPAPEDFLLRPAAVVRFAVGRVGTLEGQSVQTVMPGGSTAPISAVAPLGFVFHHWSDGVTANPRSVVGVIADVTLTAVFWIDGEFLSELNASDVASGHGWWDLSGSYPTRVAGNPLVLTLVHDAHGRLTGTATYTVGEATTVNLPIRGSVRGAGGNIALKLALRGAARDRSVRLALRLDLAVDPDAGQLVGAIVGSVVTGDEKTPVAETLTLPIPRAMNGTWTLLFDLVQDARGVTGTALLTLSNGAGYVCEVQGRTRGGNAVLSLAGYPAGPAARGGGIRTTITPLEGGWARLESFSGRGYGQVVGW
jgi:hypothetical protein